MRLLITSLLLMGCAGATLVTIMLGLILHGEVLYYEHNTAILYTESSVCALMGLWGLAMVIHVGRSR